MMLGHLLLDAIGAQALDLAADVDLRLIDRIPQALPGIAADDEAAGLGHEGAEMADRAADHDIHALHRDAAAGRGIALDDEQPAMGGGAGRLAGIAFDPDRAGHHVLRHADAAMAVDDDARLLVHAGAVIADMAVDLDLDGPVEAGHHGMRPLGIDDPPGPFVGLGRQVMQALVEVAHALRGEVDGDHRATAGSRYRRRRASAPRSSPCRPRADWRGCGIPRPWRPNRRSRPGPRACRRCRRAAPRSRRACPW